MPQPLEEEALLQEQHRHCWGWAETALAQAVARGLSEVEVRQQQGLAPLCQLDWVEGCWECQTAAGCWPAWQ